MANASKIRRTRHHRTPFAAPFVSAVARRSKQTSVRLRRSRYNPTKDDAIGADWIPAHLYVGLVMMNSFWVLRKERTPGCCQSQEQAPKQGLGGFFSIETQTNQFAFCLSLKNLELPSKEVLHRWTLSDSNENVHWPAQPQIGQSFSLSIQQVSDCFESSTLKFNWNKLSTNKAFRQNKFDQFVS